MKLGLLAVVLVVCGSVATKAQSCLTADDVKLMLARMKSEPQPAQLDKKLQSELIKMAEKQRDLLLQVVHEDQKKESTREKLRKLNETSAAKLCEILKTVGWPTTALVDRVGVLAAFHLLKNSASFELQRDLLPVIVEAIKKDPTQKPEFAGLYDRLRVSAGLKQLFGTQAISQGGFLILNPVEDESRLDALREEFGLPKMALNIANLERTYRKPLIKSRRAPASGLSKQLKDSLTKAIESTEVDADYVDPADVIKVNTSLVSLNVSVFNNKLKAFVGSLVKEDFRVVEDGVEQTISFFASTDVPFDLVLLVDLSGSTSNKRDLIQKSTLRFIEAARPADRLAIVTFSDLPDVLSPLTLDRKQLADSVKNMGDTGGSHVWDALKFTLDNVIGPPTLERRRAIVLMSDGVDGALSFVGPRGSRTTFAELMEKVQQNDALIVPIYLDTERDFSRSPSWEEMYENARRTLAALAQESGGSYYQARKLSDLNGVYEQVINDLGKVYSLGYKPTNDKRDGSWRNVQIAIVNRPDLTARARPGYYAQ